MSNFRVSSKNSTYSDTVIEYKKNKNTVVVKKKFEDLLKASLVGILLVNFLLIMIGN